MLSDLVTNRKQEAQQLLGVADRTAS